VSSLPDGTLTVGVTGNNSGGSGPTVTDDVLKDTAEAVFPVGWDFKAEITISASLTTADLTDFPLLVDAASLPDALLTTGGGQAALPDASDIRFTTDALGANLIDHEVVSFTQDATPANATAELWVKVPSITAAGGGSIYVWWGNAAALAVGLGNLWSDYEHVFHMENASGVSSTGSVTMGPLTNNPNSMDTPGPSLFGSPVGGLSGVDQTSGMEHPDPAPADLLPPTGPVHISCIFQRQSGSSFYVYESSAGTTGGVQQIASNNEMRNRIDQNGGGAFTFLDTVSTFPQGHPITVSHCQFEDGQRGFQYVDGVDDTNGTPTVFSASRATTTKFVIGNLEPNLSQTGGCGDGGLLDEFRVRLEIMTPAWIAAENNMYRNYASLITPGAVTPV
jgi:hypothetical protein